MTAFETSVRNKLRAATLGPIFARQITELYNPLVIRSFNILFQDGEMGVIAESDKHRELLEKGEDPLIIPDEVAELILKGQDVFDIEYLTPAARMMQAEEGQGIEQVWAFATERGQVKPELLDNLDEDTSVRKLTEIYGAPSSILRSIEEVAAERQARREALERQQQLEQAKTGSEAAKNASQAGILPQQRQGAAT